MLLALDSIDRKIHTYLVTRKAGAILKHNFLTHQYSNITVLDTASAVLEKSAPVLIFNLQEIDLNALRNKINKEITTLILLKASRNLKLAELSLQDFSVSIQNDKFIVLIKEILK